MDDTQATLLVAERDERVRESWSTSSLADEFAAHGAQCAEEARVKLAHLHPELLVLGELERPHTELELLRASAPAGSTPWSRFGHCAWRQSSKRSWRRGGWHEFAATIRTAGSSRTTGRSNGTS